MSETVRVFFAKLTLAAFACLPLSVLAVPAGWTEFASGDVTIEEINGNSRSLGKGGEIKAGDTIQTGRGRAQIRFVDGGYISLSPGTTFRVDEYRYEGKADGNERGFFSLVKGGLRAITGTIGHVNKQTYQVKTPTATIGIRGTEFLARMDDKLVVSVGDGAVYLFNAAGDLVLYKGQSGEVLGADQKPRYTNEAPLVNAAGPKGAMPGEGKKKLADGDKDAAYVVGENVYDSPSACKVAGICPTLLNPVTEVGIAWNWDGVLGSTIDLASSVTKDSIGRITGFSGVDWTGASWRATAQSDVTFDSNGSMDLFVDNTGAIGTISWGRWLGGHATVVTGATTSTVALSAVHVVIAPKTPSSDLNLLAANNLTGHYSVVGYTTPTLTNATTGVTSDVAGTVTGALSVNFGTGSVNMDLNAGGYSIAGASGTLDSAGSTFSAAAQWTGGAGGTGQFAASGVLSGFEASAAGVGYRFSDANSEVTGVAVFNQDSLWPK